MSRRRRRLRSPPPSPLQHTGRCYIPPFPPLSHFPQIGTRNDVSDRENREVVSERKVRQQVTLFPPSLEIPIFAAARGEAAAAARAESANLPLPSSSHFFLFLGVDGKALFCEKKGGLGKLSWASLPRVWARKEAEFPRKQTKTFFGGNCTGESFPFVGDLLGVPHI